MNSSCVPDPYYVYIGRITDNGGCTTAPAGVTRLPRQHLCNVHCCNPYRMFSGLVIIIMYTYDPFSFLIMNLIKPNCDIVL